MREEEECVSGYEERQRRADDPEHFPPETSFSLLPQR